MKQFTIITAILLIFTAVAHLQVGIGYYQLLRWITTICAILCALNYKDKNNTFFIIFCSIAVLFNPIAPIYLSKEIWKVIDFITGIIFIIPLLIHL